MSRSSDTRQRTREAAAQLVADGKRPHEITVDLIYAAIRQCSRTTINDALKAWRDERTKVDALGADLPPALADTMRSLWASAVEHGERVFDEQRQRLEDQIATERARAEATEQQHAQVLTNFQRVTADHAAEKQDHAQTRDQLVRLRDAVTAAETRAVDVEQQLAQFREQATLDQATLQQTLERRSVEFRETLASRDRSYQAEIDKTTARLQSAQDHMLLHVDAAREAQKRVEGQQAKLQQRYDSLHTEATELRLKSVEQARDLQQHAQHRNRLEAESLHHREESQRIALELAGLSGQLCAATAQLAAADERARAAETRLDRALTATRSATTASPRSREAEIERAEAE